MDDRARTSTTCSRRSTRRRRARDVGRPQLRRPACARARRLGAGASRAARAARPGDPGPAARRLDRAERHAHDRRFAIGRGGDRRAAALGTGARHRASSRGGDAASTSSAPRRALALPLLPERGRRRVRRAGETTAAARERCASRRCSSRAASSDSCASGSVDASAATLGDCSRSSRFPAATWSTGTRTTRPPTRSTRSCARGSARRARSRRARPRARRSRSRGRGSGSPRRRRASDASPDSATSSIARCASR